MAHRVLGEALGNRGMAARACLGADIAGGPRGWLLERRYRRSAGHGGFSGGRLRRLSRAGARGAGDGALSLGLGLSQARPGIPRPLPFPAGGEPAPHEEAGDNGDPRRGDKKGGIAGPGHGGDEAPMRRGDHTCLQDSGAGVPVAMPATVPPCIGHRSDVAVRQGRGDERFPGPLIGGCRHGCVTTSRGETTTTTAGGTAPPCSRRRHTDLRTDLRNSRRRRPPSA